MVLIDFIIFHFVLENKIVCILQFILGGLFATKFGSLKIIFLELLSFEILNLFQNPVILLVHYFQKNSQNRDTDYIYFIKSTIESSVCVLITPFGVGQMLTCILKIKQ